MESNKTKSGKGEKTIIYQCTMQCEGRKTYYNDENCPVCNIKLIPVDYKTI
jgi:hypothetical protein